MSLRSRARYVSKQTGKDIEWCVEAIRKLERKTSELAHRDKITLKEADLQLIRERLSREES